MGRPYVGPGQPGREASCCEPDQVPGQDQDHPELPVAPGIEARTAPGDGASPPPRPDAPRWGRGRGEVPGWPRRSRAGTSSAAKSAATPSPLSAGPEREHERHGCGPRAGAARAPRRVPRWSRPPAGGPGHRDHLEGPAGPPDLPILERWCSDRPGSIPTPRSEFRTGWARSTSAALAAAAAAPFASIALPAPRWWRRGTVGGSRSATTSRPSCRTR
jgi:hypothetical protein